MTYKQTNRQTNRQITVTLLARAPRVNNMKCLQYSYLSKILHRSSHRHMHSWNEGFPECVCGDLVYWKVKKKVEVEGELVMDNLHTQSQQRATDTMYSFHIGVFAINGCMRHLLYINPWYTVQSKKHVVKRPASLWHAYHTCVVYRCALIDG